MTNSTYAVTVTQLRKEANEYSRLGAGQPVEDAIVGVAIAVYMVGAALAERLEAMVELNRERNDQVS